MNFTFQPQLIKQDSAVPLRMMVGGWVVGVASILLVGTVSNRIIALMGMTLVAGGLVGLSLRGPRTWRMLLGSIAGAIAAWQGFRFAITERLVPGRDDPLELIGTDQLAATALGLAVLSIGVGGLLEAIRAQAAPGTSPPVVRIVLVLLGMVIAWGACVTLGIAGSIAILVAIATGAGLSAMAWLRNERPSTDFLPRG